MGGTITALVAQKRNKERVNVYIDGSFAFGLAMIEALKLHKGQQLSDADIERLQVLDQVELAHTQALNFLSYRPRSIAETRRNLKDKDYPDEAIDEVIARLERAGLLDDLAFARYWIDNRDVFKPRGVLALRHELRQKGVDDRAIDEALSDYDETDAAYRAAQAKAGRYAREDEQVFRKRLASFLSRRGFPYPIVRDAVDRLWKEQADREDPDTR